MINVGVIGCGTVGNAIISALRKSNDVNILMSDKFKDGPEYLHVSELKDCDVVFVAVPTPFDENMMSVNLEPVFSSTQDLGDSGFKGVLVIKSTIPPGTADAIAKRMPDVRVVFNPEFLREKTAVHDFYNQRNIIFGKNESFTQEDKGLLLNIFVRIINKFDEAEVTFTDYKTSELVKYSQNVMFASRVAMCNIIFDACKRFNVDYDELKGLAFYNQPLIGRNVVEVPGPDGLRGFGGKCLPKDTAGFNSFHESDVLSAILEYNKGLGREIE